MMTEKEGWWKDDDGKGSDSHQPSFTIGRHWLSGLSASHLTKRGEDAVLWYIKNKNQKDCLLFFFVSLGGARGVHCQCYFVWQCMCVLRGVAVKPLTTFLCLPCPRRCWDFSSGFVWKQNSACLDESRSIEQCFESTEGCGGRTVLGQIRASNMLMHCSSSFVLILHPSPRFFFSNQIWLQALEEKKVSDDRVMFRAE